MYHFFALILISLMFAGCHMFDAAIVKTGPGTDYPCGATGVVCTDQAAHLTTDQACCWEHSSCRMDNDGPYCHTDYYDPMSPMGTPMRRSRFKAHHAI